MNILGISGAFGHDAAAALIVDDELRCFVEEERLLRDKRAVGRYPINASRWCLEAAGLTFQELDIVATGWDPSCNPRDFVLKEYVGRFIDHAFGCSNPKLQIVRVDHHEAHAAYAIAASGYEECGVVVVDGHSERYSTSVGRFQNNTITFFDRRDISQSLGYFIEAVSDHIGLGANGAGRMMGLAGYGESTVSFEPFKMFDGDYEIQFKTGAFQDCRSAGRAIFERWRDYLDSICPKNLTRIDITLMSPGRAAESPMSPVYRNLAASAQTFLAECMTRLCKRAIDGLEHKNMVLSGGVALNCSANGEILRRGIPDCLYVPPASGDAGTALGAAIIASRRWNIKNVGNPYIGPSFSDSIIYDTLTRCGINFSIPKQMASSIAKLIATDKIVARFDGAMEVGPRALGNRSILASGHDIRMRDKVNRTKKRESWRPVAPAILSDKYDNYIKENHRSPYMLFALTPTQSFMERIPASVHADGTARVQEVEGCVGSTFHELLKTIDFETGVPAVLNTSFNHWNEPIVCTPEDALRTFFSSDALGIGSFLLEKQ